MRVSRAGGSGGAGAGGTGPAGSWALGATRGTAGDTAKAPLTAEERQRLIAEMQGLGDRIDGRRFSALAVRRRVLRSAGAGFDRRLALVILGHVVARHRDSVVGTGWFGGLRDRR